MPTPDELRQAAAEIAALDAKRTHGDWPQHLAAVVVDATEGPEAAANQDFISAAPKMARTVAAQAERIQELEARVGAGGYCAFCDTVIPAIPGFLLNHVMRGHVESCEKHPLAHARAEIAQLHVERDEAIARAAELEDNQVWRCFHCDEVFKDSESAILHFGKSDMERPACLLDGGGLTALRDAEAEIARYRDEDSDVDRQFHAIHSKHAIELLREEEKGYARGLRDAKYEGAKWDDERESLLATIASQAEEVEGLRKFAESCIYSAGKMINGNMLEAQARAAIAADGRQG